MLVQLLKYDDFFSIPSQVAQHHKIFLKDFRNQASQQRCQSHQLVIHSDIVFFFLSGFLSRTFTIHRTAGEGGGYLFNSSLPLPPASQTLRH